MALQDLGWQDWFSSSQGGDKPKKWFYNEQLVRMRHECSVEAKLMLEKKNSKQKTPELFKNLYCAKWEEMMAEEEASIQNEDQRKSFRRYLYHPGDISYLILKFDALKLLYKTPLNKIKEHVWKNRGNLRSMPRIYKSDTNPIANPQKFQISAQQLKDAKENLENSKENANKSQKDQ